MAFGDVLDVVLTGGLLEEDSTGSGQGATGATDGYVASLGSRQPVMGPLQVRCVERLTECFGRAAGSANTASEWFIAPGNGFETRFSLDPAPGLKLGAGEQATSAASTSVARWAALLDLVLETGGAMLIVSATRHCRAGDWCAPGRLASEPIYQALLAHDAALEVSIVRHDVTTEADGELESWGHAHAIEMFVTITRTNVRELLDVLGRRSNSQPWSRSVFDADSCVLLRDHAYGTAIEVVAPSPMLIDALRAAHTEWLTGRNELVACIISDLKRTGAAPFVRGMQFAPARRMRMRRLREHAQLALEREDWTDVEFNYAKWPKTDTVEVFFRATRPASTFRYIYHLAPPLDNTKRSGAAPGWYSDPYGFRDRFWDGDHWTAAVKNQLEDELIDETWLDS